jgi:hypothetical protein
MKSLIRVRIVTGKRLVTGKAKDVSLLYLALSPVKRLQVHNLWT